MLVQYLTIKGERNQILMVALFFVAFILYDLRFIYAISWYWAILMLLPIIIIVVYLLKLQMANKTVVQPQLLWKSNKIKSVKVNLKWLILPFLLYSMLTLLHFAIAYIYQRPIMPLVYDYGIGALLGIALLWFQYKNWYMGICNDGVLMGSKIDFKLITWENIKQIESNEDFIRILFIKNFPIKSIVTTNSNPNFEHFKALLQYKTPI